MLIDDLFIFDELKIAPSAELKNKQIDPMKFGYHCALVETLTNFIRKTPEDILNWYLEGTLEQHLQISHSLIQRWGIDDPEVFARDLEWVTQSIQKNVFKRIQSRSVQRSGFHLGGIRRVWLVSVPGTNRVTACRTSS